MFGSFTEPFSCAMQCVFKLKCADVSLVCFCVLQLKLGLANRIRVCARAWVRVCLGLGLGLSLGYIMFAFKCHHVCSTSVLHTWRLCIQVLSCYFPFIQMDSWTYSISYSVHGFRLWLWLWFGLVLEYNNSFEWKMWHFKGVKTYSDPSYIFSGGSEHPHPRIYRAVDDQSWEGKRVSRDLWGMSTTGHLHPRFGVLSWAMIT